MQTQKLSLANIQGKLSRAEMKNIMAGSGNGCVERWGICNATDLCCEGLTCSTGNGTNHCGI
jgi:hypothetical protein